MKVTFPPIQDGDQQPKRQAMQGFPEAVTFDQIRTALLELGIQAERVAALSITPTQMTVTAFVTDDSGQRLAHNDELLTTQLTIPVKWTAGAR